MQRQRTMGHLQKSMQISENPPLQNMVSLACSFEVLLDIMLQPSHKFLLNYQEVPVPQIQLVVRQLNPHHFVQRYPICGKLQQNYSHIFKTNMGQGLKKELSIYQTKTFLYIGLILVDDKTLPHHLSTMSKLQCLEAQLLQGFLKRCNLKSFE